MKVKVEYMFVHLPSHQYHRAVCQIFQHSCCQVSGQIIVVPEKDIQHLIAQIDKSSSQLPLLHPISSVFRNIGFEFRGIYEGVLPSLASGRGNLLAQRGVFKLNFPLPYILGEPITQIESLRHYLWVKSVQHNGITPTIPNPLRTPIVDDRVTRIAFSILA